MGGAAAARSGAVGAALRAALRDGGALALMRGAGMRVLWIAPQGCVYYPVYELMQTALTPSE